jgi:TetR/AcrR family transcriptional regulator, cholesterol catabolism regulator
MAEQQHTESRERVLAVAEQLFSVHGYTGVTLRDIAQALGIKHASLYYHVPGGKEALFVEVTERNLRRHQQGLEAAISAAGDEIEAQLQAAARWFLAQHVLDFTRMITQDMAEISADHARRLTQIAYDSVMWPTARVFQQAAAHGQIKAVDPTLLAGVLLSFIEGIHNLPTHVETGPKAALADAMIDIMLNGVRVK